MPFRYAILGSGRQGTAAAYALLKFGEAEVVTLADVDPRVAESAAKRVNGLIGRDGARAARLDAGDPVTTRTLLKGHHAALSCVPYFLNEGIAKAAVEAGVNFSDLGGNTDVVDRELQLHPEAERRKISLIPDCGLAPGLGNTLAALAIGQFDEGVDVAIRCGGLPLDPKPPLEYMLVFSIHGLLNEYSGEAEYIRNGKIVRVPTLTEVETLQFPQPVGKCEAFVTSGGTSTAPRTWSGGKVNTYDYKTIRYPGHFARIRALMDVGLFSERPIAVGPQSVLPREVLAGLLTPLISFPGEKDLVVLRVAAAGVKAGKRASVQYDILEYHEDATGFTAMERTTAYPAALVAWMQARGETVKGAVPLEKSVPPGPFVERLQQWGIEIRVSE